MCVKIRQGMLVDANAYKKNAGVTVYKEGFKTALCVEDSFHPYEYVSRSLSAPGTDGLLPTVNILACSISCSLMDARILRSQIVSINIHRQLTRKYCACMHACLRRSI